jgi:hypothetical protein
MFRLGSSQHKPVGGEAEETALPVPEIGRVASHFGDEGRFGPDDDRLSDISQSISQKVQEL